MQESRDTAGSEYTRRLEAKESASWKRWLNVQAPYRWNLRRLQPGFVLDVGCGIGRNLLHVDGNGIGVDHNAESVRVCRTRGLLAYTPDEFGALDSVRDGELKVDSLLFAHVVEHMTFDDAAALVEHYLPFLRPGGKAIFITPQQAGYRSDATHVEYFDAAKLRRLVERTGEIRGLRVTRSYSFPFPERPAGAVFPYNEFVVAAVAER